MRPRAFRSPARRARGLVAALVLLPAALAAQGPTPAQCRQAVDTALATFRSTPPQMTARDREGAEALIAELERLVQDHRARDVDACVTWQEIVARVSRS